MASQLLLVALAVAAPSARPAAPAAPARPEQSEALARQLRGFVLDFLPQPLFEDAKRWGMQKRGASGKLRNDGRWLKYAITGRDLERTLRLRVEEMVKEVNGPTRFKVVIDFDAGVLLERQTWRMGARLYSGSTRARFHVHLELRCELTSRVETGKGWFPEMVFRLKVTDSEFRHGDVVVEHTAGVGGDGAKVLGELMLGIVKAAKPNLQRDLAAKVNAAILKAGDSKEVRVSLDELLGGKKAKK